MKLRKTVATTALLSSMILLQACASSAVSDENRDTAGLYDGVWKASIQPRAGLMYIGNWTVHCDNPGFDTSVVVNNGKAFLGNPNSENFQSTNVSSRGYFSFEIPLENKARDSISSSSALADGRRKLFFRGTLGKQSPTGSYRVGVKQFGWQGCSSKVIYERMPIDPKDIKI